MTNRESWFGDSYYEATVTRDHDEIPLEGTHSADVCIVGAGYTGLSAALECRARGLSVIVVEAHRPGWGASGRNGGQVLAGFANDAEMAAQLSHADARWAWDLSVDGVSLVRERIEHHAIDCDFTPGFLFVATRARRARELEDWMRTITERYAYPHLSWLDRDSLDERVHSSQYVAGVRDAFAGHLHPLKYCLGLADAALREGAKIFCNSPVNHIDFGAKPLVKTASGEVRCDHVIVCCNAYGEQVLPETVGQRIVPIGTYIIATEPLDAGDADVLIRHREAICDNNFFLNYFRMSHDNRLLFGGRAASGYVKPERLTESMRARMATVFPHLARSRVDFLWGGFVDVTRNRAPDFGRIGANGFYAQGFSGHGVALTGIAGRAITAALCGEPRVLDLFAQIRHTPFPGGTALRRPMLELGMWYHRVKEMLG